MEKETKVKVALENKKGKPVKLWTFEGYVEIQSRPMPEALILTVPVD